MAFMSNKYVVPAVLVLLMVSAASYFYFSRSNDSVIYEEGTTTGYLITDIEIPLLDDRVIKFSDYKGMVLIVDFMAPWCPPCREQLKVLKEVEKAPNVEVISVNIDPSYNSSYLRRFAGVEGITWNFGTSTEAAVTYQTNAIPTILFVDEEGVIRYRGLFTTINQFEQLLQSYG
jgi:thiol-disulfide isomerase/thioredoxin